MRVSSWISLAVGVVSLFVSSALVIGNDDLALGGPQLLPEVVTSSWRVLFGFSLWLGAMGLAAAWIAFRPLPGLAWLALIVLGLLFGGYLGAGLVPTGAGAVGALVVGGACCAC